ncbi:MAG: penicillin-binding protein 2 [Bacilli bacterium]
MKKISKNKFQTNIKYSYYNKSRDIKEIIEKRYSIVVGLIVLTISILFISLFYIQVIENQYYINKLNTLKSNIIYSSSTPRGRIYDRNNKLLVDNIPIKVIYYKKPTGITTKEEIEIAYKLTNMLKIDYNRLTKLNLKEFWLKNNEELATKKITDDEWKQLEMRKKTLNDIYKLKLERITDKELNSLNETDKIAAYIYYLMNNGYSYSEKIIKKNDITEKEYASIAENISNLNGVNTRLDWERTYLYGDTFRTILGNVSTSESGIPYELKNHYLAKGYGISDRVGTSYLEYQYEDILKGTKTSYKKEVDGTYKVLKEGSRGNDIILTIDIELQKQIETILEEEVKNFKSDSNAKYYNRSFVIIANPKTGEILAMAGKQILNINGEYKTYDYTPGIITSPVAVGSVIKGASHIVGYNNSALKIGEVRNDACIKIASTPNKCSYTMYGNINDLDALKYSSNTYQFLTAINVGNGKYVYNQPLAINKNAFNLYRNTFSEFGLGVKTGIDLPVESLGYKGTSTLTGHLLDFSIGQYDTYTPIQLSQYIGTIANDGYRLQPYLLKEVYEPTKEPLTNLILKNKPVVLNKVNTKEEYLNRVKLGLKMVFEAGGTGVGHVDYNFKPAGKTGTSQSFIDTDNNGIIDTETTTSTFAGYAPYDDPIVSFTVVSPDITYANAGFYYIPQINTRISNKVSKKFFELYK